MAGRPRLDSTGAKRLPRYIYATDQEYQALREYLEWMRQEAKKSNKETKP
jgi:hypothetical protein